jgi:hypothetical protein
VSQAPARSNLTVMGGRILAGPAVPLITVS